MACDYCSCAKQADCVLSLHLEARTHDNSWVYECARAELRLCLVQLAQLERFRLPWTDVVQLAAGARDLDVNRVRPASSRVEQTIRSNLSGFLRTARNQTSHDWYLTWRQSGAALERHLDSRGVDTRLPFLPASWPRASSARVFVGYAASTASLPGLDAHTVRSVIASLR